MMTGTGRQDGGVQDFDGWYRREHPRVLAALLLRCGDPHLAEEVAAEAFARALERWDRLRRMDSPGGWLHTVARNQLRRRARRARLEEVLLRRRRPQPTAAPPTADPALWGAVRDLPPRMRESVVLRYVADLPEGEVARVMGITRGTVASTLHHARRRLADRLGAPASTEAHDG